MKNKTFNKNLEDESSADYQVEKMLFIDGLKSLQEKFNFYFININDLDLKFKSKDDCTVDFFATIPWFELENRETQPDIKGSNISKTQIN